MRKLAFVETAEQLAAVPPGWSVVATHPRVTVAAEISGLAFSRPEEYVPDEEIEALGLGNFARVELLAQAIDEAVRPLVGDELEAGGWAFRWLKMAFDAVSLRAWYVERILDAEAPEGILVFPRVSRDRRSPIPEDAALYPSILAAAAARRSISLELARPVRERRLPRPRLDLVLLLSELQLRLPFRRCPAGTPRVLCSDFGYSIIPISRELRALGVDVRRMPAWNLRPGLGVPRGELWRRVESSSQVRELFLWEGIDLWSAAAPHFRTLVERELPAGIRRYRQALRLFAGDPPDALLLSLAADAPEKAACAAAARVGTPTVVSRHGAFGMRRLPMNSYLDLADLVLAWGRWEAEWTEEYRGGAARVVVTGSPMVEQEAEAAPPRDEIRRRLGFAPADEIVLYLPTTLSGNHWFASRREPSDGEYLRQQQQILSALAELPVRVLVKPHPADEEPLPLELWSRHVFGDRISFSREPRYADLLHLADAAVVDAPYTTLAESLFGSAHLYVVDHPVIDWASGVVEHLREHGVRVCAAAELGSQMRSDRDAGRWLAPARFGAEAREPLAASGAGTAAARAARAILELVGAASAAGDGVAEIPEAEAER